MALDSLESERLWKWLGQLDGRLEGLEKDIGEIRLELERYTKRSLQISGDAGAKRGKRSGFAAGSIGAAVITLLGAFANWLLNRGG